MNVCRPGRGGQGPDAGAAADRGHAAVTLVELQVDQTGIALELRRHRRARARARERGRGRGPRAAARAASGGRWCSTSRRPAGRRVVDGRRRPRRPVPRRRALDPRPSRPPPTCSRPRSGAAPHRRPRRRGLAGRPGGARGARRADRRAPGHVRHGQRAVRGAPFALGISGGFASPIAPELLAAGRRWSLAFGASLNHWTTRARRADRPGRDGRPGRHRPRRDRPRTARRRRRRRRRPRRRAGAGRRARRAAADTDTGLRTPELAARDRRPALARRALRGRRHRRVASTRAR